MATTPSDEQITRMAKGRVAFRMHLMVYVAVNLFLTGVWMFTSSPMALDGVMGDYWPIWTHLGWGLGLAIHGFTAYGSTSNMLAQEEDKLRKQYGKT
jgi:hypothetical protein